jgi:hypothetical protein
VNQEQGCFAKLIMQDLKNMEIQLSGDHSEAKPQEKEFAKWMVARKGFSQKNFAKSIIDAG